MNKLGKLLTFLVIALFVGVLIMRILPQETGGHIADVNGADDFALNTITDQDILTHSGNAMGLSSRNSSSSDATVCYSECFSGVEALYEEAVPAGTSIVITGASAESGNLRIVIVSDGTIVHDFALTADTQIWQAQADSAVSLRVAGESAAFEMGFEVR